MTIKHGFELLKEELITEINTIGRTANISLGLCQFKKEIHCPFRSQRHRGPAAQ